MEDGLETCLDIHTWPHGSARGTHTSHLEGARVQSSINGLGFSTVLLQDPRCSGYPSPSPGSIFFAPLWVAPSPPPKAQRSADHLHT